MTWWCTYCGAEVERGHRCDLTVHHHGPSTGATARQAPTGTSGAFGLNQDKATNGRRVLPVRDQRGASE